MQTQSNQTFFNEFSGDEYAPEYTPLPYLQILNEQDPERSSFLFPQRI